MNVLNKLTGKFKKSKREIDLFLNKQPLPLSGLCRDDVRVVVCLSPPTAFRTPQFPIHLCLASVSIFSCKSSLKNQPRMFTFGNEGLKCHNG